MRDWATVGRELLYRTCWRVPSFNGLAGLVADMFRLNRYSQSYMPPHTATNSAARA